MHDMCSRPRSALGYSRSWCALCATAAAVTPLAQATKRSPTRADHVTRPAGTNAARPEPQRIARRRAAFTHAADRKHRPTDCVKRRSGSGSASSRRRLSCQAPRAASRPHAGDSCPGAGEQPTQSNIETIRAATLCLVNQERTSRGEAALQPNAHLQQAAQAHTESMAFGDYFEHDGPGGDTPLSRMVAAGYISSRNVGYEVGENIGWGTLSLGTPRAIVAAWMASPGHRANILDANFRDTAVGVSSHVPSSLSGGQSGGIYTQDFGVITTG